MTFLIWKSERLALEPSFANWGVTWYLDKSCSSPSVSYDDTLALRFNFWSGLKDS
jgi:hypothetical protein